MLWSCGVQWHGDADGGGIQELQELLQLYSFER
jgi:hypothetical protein